MSYAASAASTIVLSAISTVPIVNASDTELLVSNVETSNANAASAFSCETISASKLSNNAFSVVNKAFASGLNKS